MSDATHVMQSGAAGADFLSPQPLFWSPAMQDKSPASRSGMLVLVATADGAFVCTNSDGNTRLIRSIAYRLQATSDDSSGPKQEVTLVYKLIRILERETLTRPCLERVAVLADARLYPEFQRLQGTIFYNPLIVRLDGPDRPAALPAKKRSRLSEFAIWALVTSI